jgi:hypothetical protein
LYNWTFGKTNDRRQVGILDEPAISIRENNQAVSMTTSRRKRFNRKQRLASATLWLQTYTGEKIAQDYRKCFGVDWPTAFKDLEMLGVPIPADYQEAVLKTLASIAAAKEQKKAEKLALENPDQDENIAFIAGYTSGGAPYGITWDEWEQIGPEITQ